MNEPLPGLDVNLFGFSGRVLYPFYGRLVQAVTGVRDGLPSCPASDPISLADNCAYPVLGLHTDRLIVCEPMAVRNQLDRSAQVSAPCTEYPNVVYAPHECTRSFTQPPPTRHAHRKRTLVGLVGVLLTATIQAVHGDIAQQVAQQGHNYAVTSPPLLPRSSATRSTRAGNTRCSHQGTTCTCVFLCRIATPRS